MDSFSLYRPYVLLSAAMSVDAYLDDCSDSRLFLSNDDDMRRVRVTRGEFDAIMVGATTIRRDNPSLRAVDGPDPRRVTLTSTGDLDPDSRFFDTSTPPLVFCHSDAAASLERRLGDRAEVRDLGPTVELAVVLDRLWGTGVRRIMVEGGGRVHSQFLQAGLADDIRLAVAPFFVGQSHAPPLAVPGTYLNNSRNRMHLKEVEHIGDMAVMHYTLDTRRGR